MLEVPFGAVVVAFVIDVIKPVDGQDEIGRIIIDIQMNGIQAGAHGLQLPEAEAGGPVFRDQQGRNSRPFPCRAAAGWKALCRLL